jgi:hypothetical protein
MRLAIKDHLGRWRAKSADDKARAAENERYTSGPFYRIKMLKTFLSAAPDGFEVREFRAGESYILSRFYAEAFILEGLAGPTMEPADPPEEK